VIYGTESDRDRILDSTCQTDSPSGPECLDTVAAALGSVLSFAVEELTCAKSVGQFARLNPGSGRYPLSVLY
jgi:hypothetical protein